MYSRRKFIRNTSIIAGATTILPSMSFGMVNSSANDKLNVGLIGVGLRGTNHLENLLLRSDVNITEIY